MISSSFLGLDDRENIVSKKSWESEQVLSLSSKPAHFSLPPQLFFCLKTQTTGVYSGLNCLSQIVLRNCKLNARQKRGFIKHIVRKGCAAFIQVCLTVLHSLCCFACFSESMQCTLLLCLFSLYSRQNQGDIKELSSVQPSYIIDYLLVLIQSVLQHGGDHSHKTPKHTQNACTSQPVHVGHVAGTQKQIKRIKAL